MKKFIYLTLPIIALAVSCNKAEISSPVLVHKIFEASIEGSGVKTSLSEDYQVLWGGGNGVTIFANGTGYKFTASQESNNLPSATLEGEAPEAEVYYGLYPYSSTATISEAGAIKYDDDEKQNIQARDNFAGGQNISFARTDENGRMCFYNANALLKFSVPEGVSVTELQFVPNKATEGFRGQYTLKFAADGSPIAGFSPYTNNRKLVLVYNGGQTFPEGSSYYVAIPPVTVTEGYKVTITYSNGTTKEIVTTKSFTFQRNHIYFIGNLPEPSEPEPTPESILFDDFENSAIGVNAYYKGNSVSGVSVMQVEANPCMTETNHSEKVLVDKGSLMTWSSSGYFTFKVNTYPDGTGISAADRSAFSKVRVKVYVGTTGFTPLLQEDKKSTKSTPCEINGVAFDTANPSLVAWNAAIKTDDWNVFVYDLTGPKYSSEVNNLAQTDQLQFRVFVDFNNNGKDGKDVYFDDIEFIK